MRRWNLLQEDRSHLSKSLRVNQSIVICTLHAFGKIQKTGKWVRRTLNITIWTNDKAWAKQYCRDLNGRVSYAKWSLKKKSGCTRTTLYLINPRSTQAIQQHLQQKMIFTKEIYSSVYGGTSMASCTVNFYNSLNQSLHSVTVLGWWNKTKKLWKNVHILQTGTVLLSCYTAIPNHMSLSLQKQHLNN